MSETAPEAAPASARPPARAGGNVFTRRLGPLPMWVWLLIAGTGVIGYSVWKGRQQAAQATTQTDTGTSAADVPQFVNQTYTTVIPPSAPVTGPAGPPGVPGKPGPTGKPGPGPKRAPYEFLKVPPTGKTRSLAAYAKELHTTPQHIVAATEAYGRPGTALRHYFAAGNWNRPLPHGSNLYYPALGGPYSKVS